MEDDTPLVNPYVDFPTIEQGFSGLAEGQRFSRDNAFQQLAYLAERRDRFNEAKLFGLVTLNGGALLALLGALGGEGDAAKWLGFTSTNAVMSGAAFAVGLCLAGFAVNRQQALYSRETSDAFVRAIAYSRLTQRHKSISTKKEVDDFGTAMDDAASLPQVGFQYSTSGITAQSFSAGSWLFGIMVPLFTALGLE